mmetsp:Transcript_14473/g.21565  ORF Transcript_14473/g.21565 Transcript_14473/m.21565 type:complete len:220 (+) Transcript_14473:1175-1834(+)
MYLQQAEPSEASNLHFEVVASHYQQVEIQFDPISMHLVFSIFLLHCQQYPHPRLHNHVELLSHLLHLDIETPLRKYNLANKFVEQRSQHLYPSQHLVIHDIPAVEKLYLSQDKAKAGMQGVYFSLHLSLFPAIQRNSQEPWIHRSHWQAIQIGCYLPILCPPSSFQLFAIDVRYQLVWTAHSHLTHRFLIIPSAVLKAFQQGHQVDWHLVAARHNLQME